MATISDFSFRFDDDLENKKKVIPRGPRMPPRVIKVHDNKGKELKEEFVKRWNQIEGIITDSGKLPAYRGSIGLIDVKSFTKGKMYDRVQDFLNRYQMNDYSWQEKGHHHKYTMIEDVQKASKSFKSYLNNIDKLYSMIMKETARMKGSEIRYHRVYYGLLHSSLTLPTG